jgi:hypothetical protein
VNSGVDQMSDHLATFKLGSAVGNDHPELDASLCSLDQDNFQERRTENKDILL